MFPGREFPWNSPEFFFIFIVTIISYRYDDWNVGERVLRFGPDNDGTRRRFHHINKMKKLLAGIVSTQYHWLPLDYRDRNHCVCMGHLEVNGFFLSI